MDAADVAALERFMDVPYVLEAPASKVESIGPALAAVARMRPSVSLDSSKGIPAARYSEIVQDIRAQIASQVKPTTGLRFEVMDIAAKDIAKEADRTSESLKGKGRAIQAVYGAMGGAFSFSTKEAKGTVCVAVGFKPQSDLQDMTAIPGADSSVQRHDLDDPMYHRITLWHEVGHCLLGPSEALADTFGALMAVRFTNLSKDGLSVYAGMRELSEWTTPVVNDNHFMSKPLWAVAGRMEALRQDERFMSLDMEGVAAVARTFVDRAGPTKEDVAQMATFRKAFFEAGKAEVHWEADAGKLKPVPFFKWVRANAPKVPEISRVLEIKRGLQEGNVGPGTVARGGLKPALEAMKAAGDPTARKMLASVNGKAPVIQDKDPKAWNPTVSNRLDPDRYADMVVPFDPATQRIAFSPDQERFAVAGPDGRVVLSGGPKGLVSHGGATPPAPEAEDEPMSPGMRR